VDVPSTRCRSLFYSLFLVILAISSTFSRLAAGVSSLPRRSRRVFFVESPHLLAQSSDAVLMCRRRRACSHLKEVICLVRLANSVFSLPNAKFVFPLPSDSDRFGAIEPSGR